MSEKPKSKRQKETVTVDIKRDICEMLEKPAKDRNIPSIRQFINYLLMQFLVKEGFIRDQYPNMWLYSIGKSSIFIKQYLHEQDNKHNIDGVREITTEISMKHDKVYCSVDNSNDCEHVYYALWLPETATLITKDMVENAPKKEKMTFVPPNLAEGILEMVSNGEAPYGFEITYDSSGRTAVGYKPLPSPSTPQSLTTANVEKEKEELKIQKQQQTTTATKKK